MSSTCAPRAGLKRVDVIYRRIDDDFIDPLAFRAGFDAGRGRAVQCLSRRQCHDLANALGTGVADDKAIYAYVPGMIRYYLEEEPILDNVETFLMPNPTQRQHVLANLDKLVVKAVGESGGYGMLIGPHSTAAQREEFRRRIEADPRNYIAQPTIHFRARRVLSEGGVRAAACRSAAVHLCAATRSTVVPGGLTRVALRRGFAGGEFVAGRRQQGYVGCQRSEQGTEDAFTRRRQPVLDEPLPGAGGAYGAR